MQRRLARGDATTVGVSAGGQRPGTGQRLATGGHSGEGPIITPGDLPPDLAPQPDDPALVDALNEAVTRFEKQHIERMFRRFPDKKEADGAWMWP